MNNTTDKTYTREQHQLIAEFSTAYGLQPEQITFFAGDPQPFFDRDATSVLLHKLTNAVGIEDELAIPPCVGSIAVKYRVTFEDGTFTSSTGVANLEERGADDAQLSPVQVQSLATSRAARGALRNKGIDLVKLHYTRKAEAEGKVASPQFSGPARSQYESLLREVHALGSEAGYIVPDEHGGKSKIAWYRVLAVRYGVSASSALNVEQLADFAAFLRSQLPTPQAAA